ncbi:MAG: hypothetical protein H0U74_13130 [Bradymonadaceae bacterium]|nr:hypothetical protein [Lujinxingiaceae bacterium]
MMKYLHYSGLRYMVTVMAFAMALILTPRALVDGGRSAATSEVPVRVLEQPDQCLWCKPPQNVQPLNCQDTDEEPRLWLNPDHVLPEEMPSPCLKEDELTTSPSA